MSSSLLVPPQFNAFAGKLRRVATSVQMDRRLISGKIVNAMRDDFAIRSAGEIMIVHNRRLDAVRHTVAVEIPEHFLLFCVDADHGKSRFKVLLFEFSDLFELCVAVGVLSHRALLLRLATTVSLFPQQTRHDVFTGRRPQCFQSSRNLPAREIRPLDVRTHRIAGGVVAQNLQKVLHQPRTRFGQRFASPPFFRWRCVSSSSADSISEIPC